MTNLAGIPGLDANNRDLLSFSRPQEGGDDTQSQTVQDSNRDPSRFGNYRSGAVVEHDIDDSDEEVNHEPPETPPEDSNAPRTPPHTKPSRRSRHFNPDRRVTINPPEEIGAEVTLSLRLEHTDGSHEDFTAKGPESLLNQITADPERWHDLLKGIFEVYSDIASVQEDTVKNLKETTKELQDSQRTVKGLQRDLEEAQATAKTLEVRVAAEQKDKTRYKGLRDEHRLRGKGLAEKVTHLRADVVALEREVEGLQAKVKSASGYIDDSDPEDPPRLRRQARDMPGLSPYRPVLLPRGNALREPVAFDLTRNHLQSHTFRDYEEEPSRSKRDPKYDDVFVFAGNDADPKKNKENWERWVIKLKSKIWTCTTDFPTEQHKINYARDHTSDLAWKTVKARSKLDAVRPYTLLEELLKDLDNVYGDRDPDDDAMNELFGPDFPMGKQNPKETFEEFFARFQALTSQVDLPEKLLVNHLRRTLSKRLRHSLRHEADTTDLQRYIRAARRQADLNRNMDEWDSNDKGGSVRTTTTTSSTKRTNTTANAGIKSDRSVKRSRTQYALNRFPPHIQAKLRKENRCFKCLEIGHRPDMDDAPCKQKNPVTNYEGVLKLASIGCEWDGRGAEGYESDFEPGSDYETDQEN